MSCDLYAPAIRRYIQWMASAGYCGDGHRFPLDEKSGQYLDALFGVLRKLEPVNEDGYYELWLQAKRGTPEDFGSFEKFRAAGEVESFAEFEQLWKTEFPDEIEWYHFAAAENPENGFRVVSLDHRLILEVAPGQGDGGTEDVSEFLCWLLQAVEEAVRKMECGEYLAWLEANLPVKHRTGTIRRKDMWKVFPEEKGQFLNGLSSADVQAFLDEAAEAPTEQEKLLPELTANAYYRFCSLGYQALNYPVAALSPKEQYFRYADGRDGGLRDIDPDSAEAFSWWYWTGPREGHPWEVCRGGFGPSLHLNVQKRENGYYLVVAIYSPYWTVEAVRFYLALHRAGLPVWIQDADVLKDRLTGEERVGIVPAGVDPFYCDNYFPGQKIMEFMNLPSEKTEAFAALCHWQSITVSGLKEKP